MKKYLPIFFVVILFASPAWSATVTDSNNATSGQVLIANTAHQGTWTDVNTVLNNSSVITGIQSVNTTQNTNISTLQSQMTTANSNISSVQSVNTQQSTDISSLQSSVNGHTTSINNFTNSINNINSVNDRQDSEISTLNNKVGEMDNRVKELEQTQVIVGGDVRIHDSKKWEIKSTLDYSTTRHTVDRVGVRFTYKAGKSYEEKRLDELERKLQVFSEEKPQVPSNAEFYQTSNGFGVREKF